MAITGNNSVIYSLKNLLFIYSSSSNNKAFSEILMFLFYLVCFFRAILLIEMDHSRFLWFWFVFGVFLLTYKVFLAINFLVVCQWDKNYQCNKTN